MTTHPEPSSPRVLLDLERMAAFRDRIVVRDTRGRSARPALVPTAQGLEVRGPFQIRQRRRVVLQANTDQPPQVNQLGFIRAVFQGLINGPDRFQVAVAGTENIGQQDGGGHVAWVFAQSTVELLLCLVDIIPCHQVSGFEHAARGQV